MKILATSNKLSLIFKNKENLKQTIEDLEGLLKSADKDNGLKPPLIYTTYPLELNNIDDINHYHSLIKESPVFGGESNE